MQRDHIRRVVVSNDGNTRLIAISTGFYEITLGNDEGEVYYSTIYYPQGGTPHHMASKTLREAYATVRSGNPAYYRTCGKRGSSWINKTVRRFKAA